MGGYAEGEVDPAAKLRGEVTDQEIMKQAVDQIRGEIAGLRERMLHDPPSPAPANRWRMLLTEWTKPAGLIPLSVLLFGCALGGVSLSNAVRNNTETNAAQAQVLNPIPRVIERLSDRIDASETRNREELLAWREWRKTVDSALLESRDTSLDVAANKSRNEALDQRISRVVDLFQQSIKEASEKQDRAAKEASEKLERILIEQAQVKARLEARGREPDGRPFRENRIENRFRTPLILKAAAHLDVAEILRGSEP